MPSTEEAFGVAYVEAMAGGVPAIGCRGEPGPEEIAAAGDGLVLVPPGDIERLTQRIDELLSDPHRLREVGQRARATVAANFTWERCGAQTLAAYAARRLRLKPLLFVTGNVPAYRVGRAARACTSASGSSWRCSAGAPSTAAPGLTGADAVPLAVMCTRASSYALAAQRASYRAVVCPTGRATGAAGRLGAARDARACR